MWAMSVNSWAQNLENPDSKDNIARRDAEKTEINDLNNAKFEEKEYWKNIQDLLTPLLDLNNSWEWITQSDINNIEKRVKLKYKWEEDFDLQAAISETILGKETAMGKNSLVFDNGPKVENANSMVDFKQETSKYAENISQNINFEWFNSEETKASNKLFNGWDNITKKEINQTPIDQEIDAVMMEGIKEIDSVAKEKIITEPVSQKNNVEVNEIYNDKTESVLSSVRWDFNSTMNPETIVEESTVEKPNTEEVVNEQFSKLSEHTINDPKTSVMNRMVESWELSAETNQVIIDTVENDWDFNEEFNKSIDNNDELSKIESTLKLIPKNADSVPVNNISSFKQDFPDFADIAINWIEATNVEPSEIPSGAEISAYENIAENYIKIWNNPEDKEKNYSTAIKTAGANLLKNDTVIKRDTIEFKQALNNIHTGNIEQQFEWLVSLISIKETEKTDNAAKWRKIEKRSKNSTNTRLKLTKELNKLREEFTILKEASSSENLQRRIDLGKRWKAIQKLLKKEKPKSWDIITAGVLDKNKSKSEDGIEKYPAVI